MYIIPLPSERKNHIKSVRENALICNPNAVEITIHDRWGTVIWKKDRGQSREPLVWNGIDCFGVQAKAGSYLCKIVYPDDLVVYVPFVFIQK